jgi:hypothetical protein
MIDGNTTAFDGETISGNALGFSLNKMNRTDRSSITLRLRSPGFRTSNGFEKNNSTKWLKLGKGKTVYYDNHPSLLKLDYGFGGVYKTNYDGLVKKKEIDFKTSISFVDGSSMSVDVSIQDENFRGVQFDGMANIHANYTTKLNQNIKLHGGAFVGNELIRYLDIPELGDDYGVYGYVEYKLSDVSNFSLGLQYENVKDYYD